MQKKPLVSLFFALCLSVSSAIGFIPARVFAADPQGYHFQAEFEPQDAVWLSWPNYEGINKEQDELDAQAISMIRALVPHVKVKLIVDSAVNESKIKNKLINSNVPIINVDFHIMDYVDYITRDWGPIYVMDQQGNKKVVHFDFNYWGMPEYAVPEEMATANEIAGNVARLENLPLVEAGIVSEGGDRDFNGRGTMMVIEQTELQRNPGWTKAQLEQKYKEFLGVKKVIWLKRGVVDDTLTNEKVWPGPTGELNAYAYGAEHMDENARFAGSNTILLGWVTAEEAAQDPIAAESRRRILENYNILENSTDQDGQPFNIIKMPSPKVGYYPLTVRDKNYQWFKTMSFQDGSVFPAPKPVYEIIPAGYMNFFISNGVVLMPKYWEVGMPQSVKDKDNEALRIIRQVFPGREIVQINSLAYNINSGGGMHCATQPEPAMSSY